MTDTQQRVINLLVFSEKDGGDLPGDGMGNKGEEQWIKVNPRTGTHILAFFDNRISNNEVNNLIDVMFYKEEKLSLL